MLPRILRRSHDLVWHRSHSCRGINHQANQRFSSGCSGNTTIPVRAEDLEKKYLISTYSDPQTGIRSLPNVMFTSGAGAYLYDQQGKEYLDFNAGIAVNLLGHGNTEWSDTVAQQAKDLAHVSNLFHSSPPLKLAQDLIEHSHFDKVFFANSGTEANEAALKFTTLWGKAQEQGRSGRPKKMIAFKGGFHGRTLGALTVTHKPEIRQPFLQDWQHDMVDFVAFNDLRAVEELLALEPYGYKGMIVEPIQGEAGVFPASIDFLVGLRHLCTQYNMLLICDEVQTGLGRTGANLYAHEAYGIIPDIMTLAKPLAGGLPIGAVLVQDAVAMHIQPGMHGSTFGGNPLVCQAARVILQQLLRPGFLSSVEERGRRLCRGLHHLAQTFPDCIKEVRTPLGGGLYAGVECHFPVDSVIQQAAMEGQVLLISAGPTTLRLCPPLIVSSCDIDRLLSVLDECFRRATRL